MNRKIGGKLREMNDENRFGRYELLGRLGRGGMGETWRAIRKEPHGVSKEVAIKRIMRSASDLPGFVEAFIAEAKVTSQLSHGNVAQVFEFGEIDGECFMALELVQGRSLRQIIKRARDKGLAALPAGFAIYAVMEMLKGLHHAHTRRDGRGVPLEIVHRDVSPDNVLISWDGEVKVVDFGIAKAQLAGRDETRPGIVKGKPGYFSPEQARGERVDARTDVWAAGIVLYELLTGRPAIGGDTVHQLTQVARGEHPRLAVTAPGLGPAIDQVLERALAPKREQRFVNALAFEMALAQVLREAAPETSQVTIAGVISALFGEELAERGQAPHVPGHVQRAIDEARAGKVTFASTRRTGVRVSQTAFAVTALAAVLAVAVGLGFFFSRQHALSKIEPHELKLGGPELVDSFGAGPGVRWNDGDEKSFSFICDDPALVAEFPTEPSESLHEASRSVVLHYRSAGVARGTIAVSLNTMELGYLAGDAPGDGSVHVLHLPSYGLKKGVNALRLALVPTAQSTPWQVSSLRLTVVDAEAPEATTHAERGAELTIEAPGAELELDGKPYHPRPFNNTVAPGDHRLVFLRDDLPGLRLEHTVHLEADRQLWVALPKGARVPTEAMLQVGVLSRPAGRFYEGKVVSAGARVAGAKVISVGLAGLVETTVTTDGVGAFKFPMTEMGFGNKLLVASHAGEVAVQPDVAAGTPVTLELKPGGKANVSFTVDGRPANGFGVWITSARGGPMPELKMNGKTDAKGIASFEVPPGYYRAEIIWPEKQPRWSEWGRVKAGATLSLALPESSAAMRAAGAARPQTPIAVELTRGGQPVDRGYDIQVRSVAGVPVPLQASDGGPATFMVPVRGTWCVTVSRGTLRGATSPVLVEDGPAEVTLELPEGEDVPAPKLAQGHSLTVQLRDGKGHPLADPSRFRVAPELGGRVPEAFGEPIAIDAQGKVVVPWFAIAGGGIKVFRGAVVVGDFVGGTVTHGVTVIRVQPMSVEARLAALEKSTVQNGLPEMTRNAMRRSLVLLAQKAREAPDSAAIEADVTKMENWLSTTTDPCATAGYEN